MTVYIIEIRERFPGPFRPTLSTTYFESADCAKEECDRLSERFRQYAYRVAEYVRKEPK